MSKTLIDSEEGAITTDTTDVKINGMNYFVSKFTGIDDLVAVVRIGMKKLY
jgi:hypothetical protein